MALKVLTTFQADSSLDRQSAFKIQLKVSLCLLASHYTHIIKLLGCESRGVKTGTSGWRYLRASATLYQPSGLRKKKSHEKHFLGGIELSSHSVSLIFTNIKQNPTIHLFSSTTQEYRPYWVVQSWITDRAFNSFVLQTNWIKKESNDLLTEKPYNKCVSVPPHMKSCGC